MDTKHPNDPTTQDKPAVQARKPYEPPRVEKRRSLLRVTLLTGMGNQGVGIINMMN